MDNDILIVAARRTPIGAFMGVLAGLPAPALGAAVIRAVLNDTGLPASAIDEVLMGCVLPAGLGQAPARQAALQAGLPFAIPCTTLNKMCGSGMKAVMLGHDLIRAGSADIVIAGGMESMSNAPHLLLKGRQGQRMGDMTLHDHMFYDGLQDPQTGELMGCYAERCADDYDFTRVQQDEFAIESVTRSIEASQGQAFANEIIPVSVTTDKEQQVISCDEQPFKSDLEKIPALPAAFRDGGTVTAANASSISDGAGALLLMRSTHPQAAAHGALARIIGHACHAAEPAAFTTAPIGAIRKLYQRVGWTDADVDLYEINEAFAVVTMAAMQELKLDHDRVNVNGGACALGHPIGASGARIIVTLVHALRQRGLKRGIASLCIGGGEATAIAVETV